MRASSAVFAVNILITPIDSLLTEITNEAIGLVPGGEPLSITANLYFSIVSTVVIALVVTFVTERMIEPRLGTYVPESGGRGAVEQSDAPDAPDGGIELGDEPRGLRFSLYGVLVSILVVALLTVIPGAPLRHPETDAVIGDSPFMDSLIFIITVIFLVAGVCYGLGAKTMKSSVDVINAITETFASLAGLIFMLLLISQFIAYFNFSNMPTVLAVEMADLLERADIGAIWLLILFILVIAVLDIVIPGVVPKWAIFAPIFIPLFLRLDVAPQTVLAAYRVARLAHERDHAVDGLPAVHRRRRAAVQEGRRPRDGDLADAAVHAGDPRLLDALLRRLVPGRDPVRAGVPGPRLTW